MPGTRQAFVPQPIVARGFVEWGFDTKRKLSAWASENYLLPAREYWDNQSWTVSKSRRLARVRGSGFRAA
jgi:hypothetical protein